MIWRILPVALVLAWIAYSNFSHTSRSDMRSAEFSVLYVQSRENLDYYSKCHLDARPDGVDRLAESRIALQKRFKTLHEELSASRFADDMKLMDSMQMILSRDPADKMVHDAVMCQRLAPLGTLTKEQVAQAIGAVEAYIRL
jgi:hypothetical protein